MRARIFLSGIAIFVVAFLAMIVPDIYTAGHRAKQKRTSALLREWATKLEDYAQSHGGYPELPPGPVARLAAVTGIRSLSVKDGWDRDLLYHGTRDHYLLHSLGRDGRNDFTPPGHATKSLDADLVYGDGAFLQYPAGL